MSEKQNQKPAIAHGKSISSSALRIMLVLKWLVKYKQLDEETLRGLLIEYTYLNRSCTPETFSKYINTLTTLGCDISKKSQGKGKKIYYILKKTPFPISLSLGEQILNEKIMAVLSAQGQTLLLNQYFDFLEKLWWHTDKEIKPNTRLTEVLFEKASAKHKKNLQTFNQFCKDAFILELQYREEIASQIVQLQVEPYQLVERQGRFYLYALNVASSSQVVLLIDRVVSVHQLPTKNKYKQPLSHVVFSLYGRLASSYRLYPGESVVFKSEQELHIKASVLETDSIIQRLLKYGVSCQLLAPLSLRKIIKKKIQEKNEFLTTF
ncbi:MAG: WYL domain-containing protein [Cyanobacteria bacterium P01_H01_bin.74]